MKGRILLFDKDSRFRRAAMVVDGQLAALEVDRVDNLEPRVGSVYRATVETRIPALGAAFVDLDGHPGFLADAGDAQPGDGLTVQVTREAADDKASRVATALQFESRLLIHTPDRPGINVSSKIADATERKRLKATLAGFAGGYVIRTAAAESSAGELEAEALALAARARFALDAPGSGCIVEGPDAFARLLLQADGSESREVSASAVDDLLGATETADPFDHYDIESQIDALLRPRVPLSDGAWMTVEPTTALVAIDINTGASRTGDAVQRANLSAAGALPVQLRLRRLGGAIAVDFAGGPKGKARRRLEDCFADHDLKLLGWGPAGWLELQRRKPGRSLAEILNR